MKIIQEWRTMSGEQQNSMLKACILKAAQNEIGRSTSDRITLAEKIASFFNRQGLEDLIAEAWIKLTERLTPDYLDAMNERRQASGKKEITLITMAYRAAKDSIRAVYHADIKRDQLDVVDLPDGHTYFDTVVWSHQHNTETAMLTKIILDDFKDGRDHTDRLIIEGITQGYTYREIAAEIHISNPAVCKRVKRMRSALTAAIS